MTFNELFGLFYTKYRGEENPPTITDPEWEIAIRNYNSALDRLETYDDTRWDFMKGTLQASDASTKTLTSGENSFACPDDMLLPGGIWWKVGASGHRMVPRQVIKLQDVGVIRSTSDYGYFVGDQYNGYTFFINPVVSLSDDGLGLDYMYYKKLERLDPNAETGSSIIAPASTEYFACFLAAQRFLDSRNFPAYQVMKRDSEEALKQMKMRNNSGDFYNNEGIQDTGPGFGF